MAVIVHKIDPNPDTVIELTNPLKDFAVWERFDDVEASKRRYV